MLMGTTTFLIETALGSEETYVEALTLASMTPRSELITEAKMVCGINV